VKLLTTFCQVVQETITQQTMILLTMPYWTLFRKTTVFVVNNDAFLELHFCYEFC